MFHLQAAPCQPDQPVWPGNSTNVKIVIDSVQKDVALPFLSWRRTGFQISWAETASGRGHMLSYFLRPLSVWLRHISTTHDSLQYINVIRISSHWLTVSRRKPLFASDSSSFKDLLLLALSCVLKALLNTHESRSGYREFHRLDSDYVQMHSKPQEIRESCFYVTNIWNHFATSN